MMMERKMQLILLTDSFPYQQYEPFVNTEMKCVADSFGSAEVVAFFAEGEQAVSLPGHVHARKATVRHSFWRKLARLRFLFCKDLYRELRFGFSIKSASRLRIIRQCLQYMDEARQIRKVLEPLITDPPHQILYSYWSDSRTLACILLKRKYPELRIISRAHGYDVYFERHPGHYLPFRKLFAQQLDRYVFISQNGLDYTRNILDEKENHSMILSRLAIPELCKSPVAAGSKHLKLYSCSSLIPLKRVHLIIQALALCKDQQIEWHHFGSGPLEGELKKMAEEKLSGNHNISYTFRGQTDNADLLEILKKENFDFLINVSETEGIPVTMMEAMALGIPVIGTNVGGVNEIIQHAFNGYLLYPGINATELSSILISICNNKAEKLMAMKEASSQTWKQSYNSEVNYSSFADNILHL
jgi:glycosyltransferase involved in cell wall biosynthesis